jgi:hypothetical protein
VARCLDPAIGQANNAGNKIHKVFFGEPAVTSRAPASFIRWQAFEVQAFALTEERS